jgi:vacuolar-type H+-ATPase subunit I/STV1
MKLSPTRRILAAYIEFMTILLILSVISWLISILLGVINGPDSLILVLEGVVCLIVPFGGFFAFRHIVRHLVFLSYVSPEDDPH